MPGLIGFGAPIIIIAQLNLNVRSGVQIVGERWGSDGFEEEIRFHPRSAVIHGKVGGDGRTVACSGAVGGVDGELRAR